MRNVIPLRVYIIIAFIDTTTSGLYGLFAHIPKYMTKVNDLYLSVSEFLIFTVKLVKH